MRSAKEIIKEEMIKADGLCTPSVMVTAINLARIESIKECAERAETFNSSRNPYETYYEIDKQSILQLINELQ